MGQSTQGITVDNLQDVTRWFLRGHHEGPPNTALVNFHCQLPVSRIWGKRPSLPLRTASTLESRRAPCSPCITHGTSIITSGPSPSTRTPRISIPCSGPPLSPVRRSGLSMCSMPCLKTNTVLRLREHYTDTQASRSTSSVCCYLLGYSFMPRLRDLSDQHLFKMDRRADPWMPQPSLHGVADTDLIREQGDFLVRVAASLKNRTAPANVIVQRLANAAQCRCI